MTSVLLIAFLLLFVIVHKKYWKQSEKKETSFFLQSKKWIILVLIIAIPALVINFIFPEGKPLTESERLEKEISHYLFESHRKESYEALLDLYPDSMELRVRYIDYLEEFHNLTCTGISNKTYSTNDTVNALAQSYGFLTHWDNLKNNCRENLDEWDFGRKNVPYQNFLLGYKSVLEGEYEEAEIHYLLEDELYPNNAINTEELLALYRWEYPEKFKSFINHSDRLTHLSQGKQRQFYFMAGNWSSYFKSLYLRSIDQVSLLAILAALLITALWMFFIREFDFFNKEKWRDLILVFIFSCLMSNLCLILYDFYHSLGFGIGDGAINDLFYSVFVIGSSEEIVKLIPWILFGFFSKKLKEPFDYILYASVSALGFAFIENWMYLEEPWNITIRSVMSTTSHMFDASIIAYAIILARFKYKTKKAKILLPIIGFFAAAISHGFYDFWLISPDVKEYAFITKVFFILSFHVWFYFINNATNLSPFYKHQKVNRMKQMDFLTIGLISVLALEYTLFSLQFSAESGNELFFKRANIIFIFLLYCYVLIYQLSFSKGKWLKFKIPIIGNIGQLLLLSSNKFNESKNEYEMKNVDVLYYTLDIYVSKSNKYVKDLFPKKGVIQNEVTVDGSEGWYILKWKQPIRFHGHHSDFAVIKTKSPRENLTKDKVEIILLFPKSSDHMTKSSFQSRALTFTGKAFSRPNE